MDTSLFDDYEAPVSVDSGFRRNDEELPVAPPEILARVVLPLLDD